MILPERPAQVPHGQPITRQDAVNVERFSVRSAVEDAFLDSMMAYLPYEHREQYRAILARRRNAWNAILDAFRAFLGRG